MKQLPEPIRVAGEVMTCQRRPHAWVDSNEEHADAGANAVPQPAVSARVSLAGRRHPFECQLLQAVRCLRQIEIPPRVGGDLMPRVSEPRGFDRSDEGQRLPIDDRDSSPLPT